MLKAVLLGLVLLGPQVLAHSQALLPNRDDGEFKKMIAMGTSPGFQLA